MTRVDAGYTATPAQNNQQASHFSNVVSNTQTQNTGTPPDDSYTRIEDHRLSPDHPANAQTEPLKADSTKTEEDISEKDKETLKNGSDKEKLSTIERLLKEGFTVTTLKSAFKDNEKIAGTVEDVATLMDSKAPISKKVAAFTDLVSQYSSVSTLDFAKKIDPAIKTSASYAKYIDAFVTLLDPSKSGQDKFFAAYDGIKALKDTGINLSEMSDAFKALRYGKVANPAFRIFDNAFKIYKAGQTIADDTKSIQEKIAAGVEAGKAALDLTANLHVFKDTKDVWSNLRKTGLSDELINTMRFASDPVLKDSFIAAAKNLKSGAALRKLTTRIGDLSGDAEAQKSFLKTVEKMGAGVADELLLDVNRGKMLTNLISNLDGPARESLSNIIGSFDKSALTSMLDTFDAALKEPGGAKLINTMLPLFAKADGKVLANTFKLYGYINAKLGNKVSPKMALKLLKGVGKIIPVVGAGMAGIDAYKMGTYAADKSLPRDIRILAGFAAQLNAGDVALSIAEPFIAEAFGIPIAVDMSLAAAEVVMDVIVSDQVEKAKADPNYSTPGWVKAFATAVSVLSPSTFFTTLF